MKRAVLALVLVVAVGAGVTAVAVGSGSPAKAKRSASVKLRSTKLGRVVVDARGRTLYLFEKDKHGRSACSGACAQAWPPALVKGKPVPGKGIAGSKLGTTTRSGGSHQITLGGHPLYRFIKDARPGDTKGQNVDAFGAEWYVVNGSGRKIEKH
jgi:predicted lipoprotein with Yx(FWY)xxD motif